MKFSETELPGVIVVEPDVHGDDRGFFLEVYHEEKYRRGGIGQPFVQDNHSLSGQGILRGLHAQRTLPQGKLVRCSRGEIFDVAVDIRRGSPTFLQWVGQLLSSKNHRQLYVPPGFAHGFVVRSEQAEVHYKCTDFYAPEDEISLLWNDPAIGIDWGIDEPLLSAKDAEALTAEQQADRLPIYSV